MHKQLEDEIQAALAISDTHNQEEIQSAQETVEPIETFHIYPTQGGIFITKEEATEPIIESTPTITKPPLYSLMPLLLCSLLLIGLLAILPNTPTTKLLTISHSFTLPLDLQSRTIPPVTIRQAITVATTGIGHQDATYAHGYLTFYNGSFSAQGIPQNMIFTTASGVQIVTDETVTIPAGTPPTYGIATAAAHALNAGTKGNIPSYSINTACCALSVKAVNTDDFTGGKNARDYHIVTKQDIDNGVTPLTQSLYRQEQNALYTGLTRDDAFIPLPCSTNVTTNHHVGEEAAHVTLHVSATCLGIAYSQTSLQEKARQLVHIPTGFVLARIAVHLISTTLTNDHKGAIITVAVTAVICFHEYVIPRVK